MTQEIDLVYLWVDGNDPEWLARKRAFTGEFREGTETETRARYIDNDELRYSLRSAEKYAPWIRRIFIVTDSQTPSWLDTSNPRVRIVDQKDILPPETFPCYNSAVIEYFLYRIPGLAEHFLYANDDMFFGAPLTPGFFFDEKDGRPVVRLKRKVFGKLRWKIKRMSKSGVGYYRQSIIKAAEEVERVTGKYYSGVPHHNIDAYTLSDNRCVAEEIFADEISGMLSHHIRTEGDLQRVALSYWALAARRAKLEYVNDGTSLRILGHNPDYMATLNRWSPSLFCINDGESTTDSDRARIKPFLESLFPDKSAFEK